MDEPMSTSPDPNSQKRTRSKGDIAPVVTAQKRTQTNNPQTNMNKNAGVKPNKPGPRRGGGARLREDEDFEHGDELYCICKKPYDPNVFMIGCDHCDGWFHANCVNISMAEAKRIESYTCPKCKARKEEEELAAAEAAASAKRKNPKRTNKVKTYIDDYGNNEDTRKFEDKRDQIGKVFFEDDVFKSSLYSNDEDDSDVYLSSEEDELLEESADTEVDRFRIIKRDVIETWDESIREALSRFWDELYSQESVSERIIMLKRIISECEKSVESKLLSKIKLDSIKTYRQILSAYISYQRKGKDAIGTSLLSPPYKKPRVLESVNMINCLKCQGLISGFHLLEHIQKCLEYPEERPQPIFVNEITICAFPLHEADSELPLEDSYCCNAQNECTEHFGWELLVRTEMLREEYVSKRKIELLQSVLQETTQHLAQ